MIERPDQGVAAARSNRRKRIWHVAAWLLGIIFFSKVDNILWGYLGMPTANMMSVGLAILSLLAAIWIRFYVKKWVMGTVVALLVFLAFEPVFPPPYAMHLLGYSLRVKAKLDVPAVRAWAQKHAFPTETSGASSQPADAAEYLSPSRVPPSWQSVGYRIHILRSDRTVSISNGGTFTNLYGVKVGPAVVGRTTDWSYFKHKMGIKIDEDVYVWCEEGG